MRTGSLALEKRLREEDGAHVLMPDLQQGAALRGSRHKPRAPIHRPRVEAVAILIIVIFRRDHAVVHLHGPSVGHGTKSVVSVRSVGIYVFVRFSAGLELGRVLIRGRGRRSATGAPPC